MPLDYEMMNDQMRWDLFMVSRLNVSPNMVHSDGYTDRAANDKPPKEARHVQALTHCDKSAIEPDGTHVEYWATVTL